MTFWALIEIIYKVLPNPSLKAYFNKAHLPTARWVLIWNQTLPEESLHFLQ